MTKVSKKKAEALVRRGAKYSEAAKPEIPTSAESRPKPVTEAVFSKQDIKDIMVEAMKIANKREPRGTSRLTVKRDSRGFIETVDITPIERTLN